MSKSDHANGVDPAHEERARGYSMLENGATMGTVCEYLVDDWSWVVITDLPDKTWGDVFDENDDRSDEKVVRFLNLEKVSDAVIGRFEDAVGCYEHVVIAREYRDAEGAGNYMRRSDFLEKFDAMGPIHPDARGEQ
ncbi:hypothetical protein CP556_24895 [Natrinema sp. CBA1119]|uniref:hypothetical protein n=1 Tax=Natrinema sp. CBA1119 TaxID=1608465 RepID=UPI000BF6D70A|nr:hypothetical protein [Natrinema sp. CBA1119]PGF14246.1 hypothetical protein CP556_24895 [Natrinema sp. CBA1119]